MATLVGVLEPGAAVFSFLLVATGIAKIRRPIDTSRALSAFGFPNHRAVGLTIGAVEVVVGLAAIITSATIVLLAQAALYAAFTAWILMAMVRDVPVASCGCLGTPDTPPYWGHLVVDVLAVAFSLGAALAGPRSPFSGSALHIVTVVFMVALGTYLSWLVIGDGARVRATYRS